VRSGSVSAAAATTVDSDRAELSLETDSEGDVIVGAAGAARDGTGAAAGSREEVEAQDVGASDSEVDADSVDCAELETVGSPDTDGELEVADSESEEDVDTAAEEEEEVAGEEEGAAEDDAVAVFEADPEVEVGSDSDVAERPRPSRQGRG
jgi:hypothetical protein